MLASDIRKIVLAKIYDLLGTYTLNGSITPAIRVGNVTLNAVVAGLEAFIPASPVMFRSGINSITERWTIYLIQRGNDISQLPLAASRLLDSFPNAEITDLTSPRTSLDIDFFPSIEITWENRYLI
jgi:hypothetical protein